MATYLVFCEGTSKSFPWSISGFVTAKTTDEFTNYEIAASELTTSEWNKFVYRVYEGTNVDQDTCTTMCVFDFDNVDGTYDYGCHFTVLDGTKCYLGSMGYESNRVSSITANNLNFMQCKIMFMQNRLIFTDIICSIYLDAFQTDGVRDTMFPHKPAVSALKSDVESYIFKQLTAATYYDQTCAGRI